MIDLTQKMLDDYKPHIKPESWKGFVQRKKWNVDEFGPIVRIENEYALSDSTKIIEKRYFHEKGIYFVLEAFRVGLDSLPK
jgi:hypothetical protein